MTTHDHDVSHLVKANILRNTHGEVAIAFDDPAYVRSDFIRLDLADKHLHAVLDGTSFPIGPITNTMIEAFTMQDEVLLAAPQGDDVYELKAAISVI